MNSSQQTIAIEIKNLRECPDKAPVGDERIADYGLLRMIGRECSDRLEAAREKGRHGWWDDKVCSIASLKASLAKAITKGDMIDVINFAAMIHAREAVDGKDLMQLIVFGTEHGFDNDEPRDLSRTLNDAAREHYLTQPQITAFHPLTTHRHDCYNAALVMVSERHCKADLTDMVTAILEQKAALIAHLKDMAGRARTSIVEFNKAVTDSDESYREIAASMAELFTKIYDYHMAALATAAGYIRPATPPTNPPSAASSPDAQEGI